MRKTIKHNISFDINGSLVSIPTFPSVSNVHKSMIEREKKERKIKRNYGGKNQNLDGIE